MKIIKATLSILFVFLFLSNSIIYAEDQMEKGIVKLPKPILKGTVSVEETIEKRRSVRRYSKKDITLKEVSQLLWAAQGITGGSGLRAAPSAGATYPLEVYVVKKDGIFHYSPQDHGLRLIVQGDKREKLKDACWGQGFVAQAPLDIVISAVYDRVTSRYGERGIRYTDIEVGHAAENVHLQAVALGLDSVPVGAFKDDEVSTLLGLSKEEKPIYIIPVGYGE